MPTELRSVTVKFRSAMFDQVKLIAEKRGETVSDTIRHLIKRGLDERVYEENAELLAKVVKDQMETVIKSYVIFPSLDNTEQTVRMVDSVFDRRVSLSRNQKDTHLYS